jgi:hypothetical protein
MKIRSCYESMQEKYHLRLRSFWPPFLVYIPLGISSPQGCGVDPIAAATAYASNAALTLAETNRAFALSAGRERDQIPKAEDCFCVYGRALPGMYSRLQTLLFRFRARFIRCFMCERLRIHNRRSFDTFNFCIL